MANNYDFNRCPTGQMYDPTIPNSPCFPVPPERQADYYATLALIKAIQNAPIQPIDTQSHLTPYSGPAPQLTIATNLPMRGPGGQVMMPPPPITQYDREREEATKMCQYSGFLLDPRLKTCVDASGKPVADIGKLIYAYQHQNPNAIPPSLSPAQPHSVVVNGTPVQQKLMTPSGTTGSTPTSDSSWFCTIV